jgi:hypothetical protein
MFSTVISFLKRDRYANKRNDDADKYGVERDTSSLLTILCFRRCISYHLRLSARTEIKYPRASKAGAKIKIRLQKSRGGRRRGQEQHEPPPRIRTHPYQDNEQDKRNEKRHPPEIPPTRGFFRSYIANARDVLSLGHVCSIHLLRKYV